MERHLGQPSLMKYINMLQTAVCVIATLSCLLQAATASPIPDSQSDTATGYIHVGEKATNDTVEEGSFSPANATTTTMKETAEEEGVRADGNKCRVYLTRRKDRDNCDTGTKLGAVNHMKALGISSVDLSSCDLPNFPQAK